MVAQHFGKKPFSAEDMKEFLRQKKQDERDNDLYHSKSFNRFVYADATSTLFGRGLLERTYGWSRYLYRFTPNALSVLEVNLAVQV